MSNQTLKDIIRDEYKKCLSDPIYFMRKYCQIQHPTKGKIPFHLYPFQEKVLRDFHKHDYNIILKSRQLGISTLSAGYSLWLMTFFTDKNILVIATKQDVAKNLVLKVKVMYENLPSWLRLPAVEANKLSLRFNNGSQIKATSAAGDSGRSEALSLLIVDECISGDTIIDIQDPVNKNISVSVEELYEKFKTHENEITTIDKSAFFVPNNLGYKVLSTDGFNLFSGIKKLNVNAYIHIVFTDNTYIKCTLGHLLKYPNNEYLEACHVLPGDILFSGHEILSIECIEDNLIVYDLTDVSDVNEYYTNKVVSHNCAFITSIEEIWISAQQTLATGGRAIILSTPNGTGNFFHKTWVDAETNPRSRFNPIKLHWTVHPDRDQAWRDKQDEILGVKGAAQECDASFISSGHTVIEGDILQWYLQTTVQEPVEKRGFDANLWIWEQPDYTKTYIVVADVARGDGADYSAFHVIDVESVTQVAEYKGQITTKDYGNMLVNIATEYNDALLVIENANVGWASIQVAIDRGYKNLYYSPKDSSISDVSQQLSKYVDLKNTNQMTPGFTTSSRTRPLVISKLDTYMRERVPVIRSRRLIEELFVFIWSGSRAEAQHGYNDDLVMSFCISLWIRDTALKLRQQGIDMHRKTLDYLGTAHSVYNQNFGMSRATGWTITAGNGQEENLTWLL